MDITTQEIEQMFHDHRYEFDLYNGSIEGEKIELIRKLQGPNGKFIVLLITQGNLPARQSEGSVISYDFIWNLNDLLMYSIKHAGGWKNGAITA